MNKQQFLAAIEKKLTDMEPGEREASLAYYEEMLNDRMEEGMTEEQAVADMGDVDELTAAILSEPNIVQVIKDKITPRRSLRAWEIVLIVLGSPLWVSLLAAAASIVLALAITALSLYLVLWVIVGCIYIVSLSLAISAVAGVVGCVTRLLMDSPYSALILGGCGLLCGGLAILVFLAGNLAAKGMAKGTALLFRSFGKRK